MALRVISDSESRGSARRENGPAGGRFHAGTGRGYPCEGDLPLRSVGHPELQGHWRRVLGEGVQQDFRPVEGEG